MPEESEDSNCYICGDALQAERYRMIKADISGALEWVHIDCWQDSAHDIDYDGFSYA